MAEEAAAAAAAILLMIVVTVIVAAAIEITVTAQAGFKDYMFTQETNSSTQNTW